ncbi:unnamed protein product [Calypogeia fissa]
MRIENKRVPLAKLKSQQPKVVPVPALIAPHFLGHGFPGFMDEKKPVGVYHSHLQRGSLVDLAVHHVLLKLGERKRLQTPDHHDAWISRLFPCRIMSRVGFLWERGGVASAEARHRDRFSSTFRNARLGPRWACWLPDASRGNKSAPGEFPESLKPTRTTMRHLARNARRLAGGQHAEKCRPATYPW